MAGHNNLLFWTEILDLPGVVVVHIEDDAIRERYHLTLNPKHDIGVCPSCGKPSQTVKQRRTRDGILDLPIGSRAVELTVRMSQFECERCGNCFTPPLDFLTEGSHATERLLKKVADLIRCADVVNAAEFFGVPEKTLEDWYYAYVERQQQQAPETLSGPIQRLGIDELSFKKGRCRFVAVIVDHDHQRVLEVLENREKATILAYLKASKSQGILAAVKEVTTDMWDPYVEAAREAFGEGVAITIDRFHVMKNFQEGLTAARRQLQRELPAEDKAQLKGSRWWWLTNPENMEEEDRVEFARLRQQFPQLGALWEQREKLRAIFEDRTITTATEGRKRLGTWMAGVRILGLSALNTFCKTLTNWLDKIANYFRNRSSNGRTEGLNHGLRAILWRAYGMFNFRHFRLRVLDRFGSPKA